MVDIFNFENTIIPILNEKIDRNGYVKYGDDNKYPIFLYDLYNDCAEHQSIVDGITNYVLGSGMISDNPNLNLFLNKVNKDNENINDILMKCILDYIIFGGFSIQVIPNRQKELVELYWVDFMNCRISEDEILVYYSKDWDKKWGNNRFEVFNNFNGEYNGKSQIYYFKGYKTRGVYPSPLYNGAIRSIMTSIEIDKFHLNNISNGFQASTIISFNNGEPTIEQKKEIEKKINEKFSGTSGQKLMTIFNESKEKGVEIQKMNADDFGEQFQELDKNTRNNIFTAHKVTSPALFGVIVENQGFSKTEFNESFEIFNNTIIKSYQNIFIKEFTKLFNNFYNDFELKIKPFELN